MCRIRERLKIKPTASPPELKITGYKRDSENKDVLEEVETRVLIFHLERFAATVIVVVIVVVVAVIAGRVLCFR